MARPQVFIDYPGEDERITSNVYSFRVGTTPQAARVEISVDGGPWAACRFSSGYWWYDWVCFETGEHTATARAQAGNGTTAVSKSRRFKRA